MSMQFQVEIKQGHDDVNYVYDKNNPSQVNMIKQNAFIDMGGPYPERCKITVEKPMPPGNYKGQPNLRIGRFGDLEINNFQPWKLEKVGQSQPADRPEAKTA